ncbi:phosphatase PAP2 family protein [Tsukamurella sp. 8F]|uniref:phosphatase PAP2 family protein n=1 Tax=unclassified Tsukamurella TaxID=2633480 RepID=UPI0023B88A79|nr:MULTISPECIES: phosphatase PAP2 family protein [unclassified Tsukamurella]MDF0529907.1 phosphatase PAP2 family protein [Tsukamurella sp. 8J]MDF0587321.1 phosphatase PAP2 family protein [Tsukamurella sp. 8F]
MSFRTGAAVRWLLVAVCIAVVVALPLTFPPGMGATAFDRTATDWVRATFHPVARVFLAPSETPYLLPVVVVGVGFYGWAREFRRAALLIATPAAAVLLNTLVLKQLFGRTLTSAYVDHPFLAYPSGHTVAYASVAAAFVLAARTGRGRAAWAVAIAATLPGVAAGLIWYGYHLATDVIAGLCVAVAVALVVAAVVEISAAQHRHRRDGDTHALRPRS